MKRILIILLTLTLVLSLSACGAPTAKRPAAQPSLNETDNASIVKLTGNSQITSNLTYSAVSTQQTEETEFVSFSYESAVSDVVTLNIYMSVTSPTAHIWGINLDLLYDENLTLLSVDGRILQSSFSTPLDSANATHAVIIAQDMGMFGNDKVFDAGKYLFATLTFRIDPACQAQSLTLTADSRTSTVDHKSANTIVADFGASITIPLAAAVMYGDATGDGVVDGMDVIRLKKYLANYNYETGTSSIEISAGADATGDGIVDGMDIIRLKKYLANYNYETGESTIPLGP